jgi:hypothetical protein
MPDDDTTSDRTLGIDEVIYLPNGESVYPAVDLSDRQQMLLAFHREPHEPSTATERMLINQVFGTAFEVTEDLELGRELAVNVEGVLHFRDEPLDPLAT